jgi:hypothetical protein
MKRRAVIDRSGEIWIDLNRDDQWTPVEAFTEPPEDRADPISLEHLYADHGTLYLREVDSMTRARLSASAITTYLKKWR